MEHGLKKPRRSCVVVEQIVRVAAAAHPLRHAYGFHVHCAGPVNGLYPRRPAIYAALCTCILGYEVPDE